MATTAVLARRVRKRIPAKDVAPRIILRGNLLSYKTGLAYSPPPAGSKRDEITRFTKASRLRMLKFVATIDYTSVRASSFLTLSYPPECECRTFAARTRDRFLIMRKIEDYHDDQISGLWRTEWKVRLSGPTKGNIAPHVHLLLFKVKYIPRGLLVAWWKAVIHSTIDPVVDIRRAVGKRGAAAYISKYCGKVESTCLVNASYLHNRTGRHWGYLRRHHIPRWPEEEIESPTEAQTEFVYRLAQAVFPQGDIRPGESFTLFGDFVAKAGKIIRKKGLTYDRAKP